MDIKKLHDYELRKKTVLKWYEYVMKNPDEEITEEIQDKIKEDLAGLSSDEAIAARYSDEEVDLATTGLSEEDQALVADIMARFEQVKSAQANVDSLFSSNSESAEKLIDTICAPKQNNVDDLVKKAYDSM